MNNENKTYEINTIADFLKVPAERQADCLKEFASFLAFVRLAQTVGTAFNSPIENGAFVWVDDGKTDIGVRLHDIKTGEFIKEIKM